MREYQNVTVSLPTDLLREARHRAADGGLSLSEFLGLLLKKEIEAMGRYEDARDRALAQLDTGLPLGTEGQIPWQRSELHGR